jgi:PAS domain S-box-containing protein
MKLTTQLIVIIVAISTLSLTLFGSYQYVSTRNKLYEAMHDQLNNDIKFINASIIQPLYDYDDKSVKQILLAAMNNAYILSVQLYDAEEKPPVFLYGYSKTEEGISENSSPPENIQGIVRTINLINYDVTIGKIEIVASDHIIQGHMRDVITDLLLEIFFLNLLLIAFLIVVFRSKMVQPIIALTAAAQQLSHGDLNREIPRAGAKELSGLGESIDLLRQSILSKIARLEEKNVELFNSEKKLMTTLNSIGDAVIATDEQGRVALMNPVAEKLTGWSSTTALGKALAEVFNIINAQTREQCDNPLIDIMRNNTQGLSGHSLLIAKNGSEFFISINGAPIRDENATVIGIVLVFRDLSKEHKLERQLRQSHKLEAVGLLAGGVAHDFNNVLGGIIGAAELLEIYLPAESPSRVYQKTILEASLRAADLTEKLLTFSRKNTPVSTLIDIHDLWNEIDSLLSKTIDRNIEIIYKKNAKRSCTNGDPSLLQSAFLNICINASHAMPQGGIMTISTENRVLDAAECEKSAFAIQPGPYLLISIADTGCGIEHANLVKIFDPFFTTKKQGEGTGLGLSSTYGTICQHHGSIEVDSKIGVGTRFVILLPSANGNSAVKKKANMTLQFGSGKILLVDDEPIVRATALDMLQAIGYEVIVAADGEEAIELFKAQTDEIDLVLLDMIMPKMNGQECFSELQKIDANVQAILCSGFVKEERIEQMKISGLVSFLKKPYRINELSTTIHSALNRVD